MRWAANHWLTRESHSHTWRCAPAICGLLPTNCLLLMNELYSYWSFKTVTHLLFILVVSIFLSVLWWFFIFKHFTHHDLFLCMVWGSIFFPHAIIKLPQHFFTDSVFDFLELLADNPYTEIHFSCYNFIVYFSIL